MGSDEPDFIVVGEKVALGPLRRDLAAAYARWMNQLEVRGGLDSLGIATPQSQEKWVEDNIERSAEHEPKLEVTIERVAYDAEAVAAEVREAGLPDAFADKLLVAS